MGGKGLNASLATQSSDHRTNQPTIELAPKMAIDLFESSFRPSASQKEELINRDDIKSLIPVCQFLVPNHQWRLRSDINLFSTT